MADDKPTRVDELLSWLKEEIFSGRIAPGARLDEQELARRFNISRTPVREALRHLASAGVVESRRHHGTVVKEHSISELIEMFQVIAELEGLCARLAARRMTAKEQQALREAHEACARLADKGEQEAFYDTNRLFHELIYAGSHNGFLRQQTLQVAERVNAYRRYITYQPGRMEVSVREHQAVIDAIESGDGEAAHREMRAHVNVLGEAATDFIAMFPNVSAG